MDETTFAARWQALTGGRPLPSLPEVDRDIPTDNGFLTELNGLCDEVVSTLRAGNAEEREVLATRLEQAMTGDLPLEGVRDFFQVLVVWLRGQETQPLAEKLPSPFRDVYTRMVAAVKQKEMEGHE